MIMNIILITGASSGIGREFARQMDKAFHTIDAFWLVARSETGLRETESMLSHPCRLFSMDITIEENLSELEQKLRQADAQVRMLINCAGYGILGPFAENSLQEETGMIRLNCEALTGLTHRILPYMPPRSRIIQLASSAAFLPQRNFAVYAASKSYVLSFSRALNAELASRKIYVTAVCPGPVDTPFFDIACKTGKNLAIKKYVMADASQVVTKALMDSLKKRSKSVYSLPILGLELVARIIPHDWILAITGRME